MEVWCGNNKCLACLAFQPECEGTGEVVPTPFSPQYEEEEEVDEESEEEEEEEEECSEGYVLSSSGECEDFDECSEGNGGCEETCVNKPGTHECMYHIFTPSPFLDLSPTVSALT